MKKGFTLFIAFVMLFTMQTGIASAASFTDTVGTDCETAVDVLSALGIVEGKAEGSYEPDSSLTRAEMATIILRAMNMAEGAKGQDIFTDIPSSHWAYANITAAYQIGIVNGTSATTFAPDAAVTYEQAVKMVVAALGYTVQAEVMGGYPTGYLAKAAHLDVLKGVATGGDMTRGNMAILMYNALDKPLFEKTSYGEDSYAYGTSDATILTRYLKVEKITGKVVQTPMACADLSPARVLSDEVRVSDGTTSIVMKKGESRAQNLLGVRTEIFYREDEITDTPVIVAVVPRASSKVLDISANDIDAGNTTTQKIAFEKEGKEEEANITGAVLVYNGRVHAMDTSLLKPEIGTVRLVSETGADYNLVIVESYTNYIVQSVNTEESRVTFKNGAGSMKIDFSDNSVNMVLTDEKGTPITLQDIDEWDVLSVCCDREENPSVFRIYRSNQTVQGTIRELDAAGKEVLVDSIAYPIAYSMNTANLKLGKTAVYHLDFTGAVANVTEAKGSNRVYAWLSAAQNTKGMDPMPQLKMFTQDGEWKVFKTTEYVELNGERIAANTLLSNGKRKADMYLSKQAPTLVDDTGKIEPQLIAYEMNEEGLLTKIETAYNMTKLDIPDDEKMGGTYSLDFYQNDRRQSRFFDGTKLGTAEGLVSGAYQGPLEYSGTMFTKVFVGAQTKYFVIPGDLSNEKAYFIKKATNEITLERLRTDELDCQAFYDVGENYVCGAVVLRKDIRAQGQVVDDSVIVYPSYEKPAGLVLGMSKMLDSDGMVVDALKVYNSNGQEVLLDMGDIEYVQYRNANARMWDATVNGETLKGDPDWYMLKEDGTKYQPTKDSAAWKNRTGTTRNDAIFIDIEDIVPGDIIQYEADDSGKLSRICMVYRHEYPGDLEFSYRETGLLSTGLDLNYLGGNLSLNGKVKKVFDSGILAEVNLPAGVSSDLSTTLGLPLPMQATRMLPMSGKFAVWDRDRQEMREITAADVMVADEIYAWWQTSFQRIVVIYR